MKDFVTTVLKSLSIKKAWRWWMVVKNCWHLPLKLFYLVLSSKLVIEIRGNIHQCSTSSFCTCRSRKRKKDRQLNYLFVTFGICACKSCSLNIDKIDTRGQFHQCSMNSYYTGSQKRKEASQVVSLFWAFEICMQKICS